MREDIELSPKEREDEDVERHIAREQMEDLMELSEEELKRDKEELLIRVRMIDQALKNKKAK